MKNLEEFQEHAKKNHRGIWQLKAVVGVPDKSVEEDKTLEEMNDNEDLLAPSPLDPSKPSRDHDLGGSLL